MTISDREQYHCFLDCIAYSLRSGAAIEHRPLYFGNWDSPFVLEKDGTFLPNAEQHALQGYLKAYESLYCDNLWCWYDYELDKESNYLRMKELLKSKANSLHLCVQLDLFYLPYEKRNYQRHHMPHFVLIEEWGGGRLLHCRSIFRLARIYSNRNG